MVDVCFHERKDIGIVGDCGKNQFTIAECLFNSFCHIISCKIKYGNFRAAFLFQLLCQNFYGFLCISINR